VLRSYRGGWALKLHAARWARSTVWSRAFTIRALAGGLQRNVVALVPVLDMIDHSPHADVVWHTGRDGNEPFQFMPLLPAPKVSITLLVPALVCSVNSYIIIIIIILISGLADSVVGFAYNSE
jgi:hypothetical protein